MAFSFPRIGNQGAIPSYGDFLASILSANPMVVTNTAAAGPDTLTGFQIDAGIYVRSGATAAVAATTDTATNIINAVAGTNPFVGMTFMMFYVNLNTSAGVVTVAGGTGVTTSGTMTIPIAGLRVFIGTITNITPGSQAVVLQGAFSISANVAA